MCMKIGKWLATAACLAMGTAAAAQTVSPKRIVAFGDSCADDDNLFRILGTPSEGPILKRTVIPAQPGPQ